MSENQILKNPTYLVLFDRPCCPMDKAPDFGSEDCELKSRHGHSFFFFKSKCSWLVWNTLVFHSLVVVGIQQWRLKSQGILPNGHSCNSLAWFFLCTLVYFKQQPNSMLSRKICLLAIQVLTKTVNLQITNILHKTSYVFKIKLEKI